MDDGGTELSSDSGDGHVWVDLSLNLEVKSTSAYLFESLSLLTYNKGYTSNCPDNSIGLWSGPSEIKV